MFNWFKQSAAPAAKQVAKPAMSRPKPSTSSSPRPRASQHLARPTALPQVVEGNEHSDWALWEESVSMLDSQMQSVTPSARIYQRDSPPSSQFEDIDAFSRVGKNAP